MSKFLVILVVVQTLLLGLVWSDLQQLKQQLGQDFNQVMVDPEQDQTEQDESQTSSMIRHAPNQHLELPQNWLSEIRYAIREEISQQKQSPSSEVSQSSTQQSLVSVGAQLSAEELAQEQARARDTLQRFIADGRVSNGKLESYYVQISQLPVDEQRYFLKSFAKAVNQGQIKIVQ